MNNMTKAIVVLKNQFQGIGNLVKEKGGTVKPKWKVKVYTVLGLPVDAQNVLVIGMDWHEAKGSFQICFGHKTPRAQRLQYLDRVVHANILQGIRIFWDVVIYTIAFREGKVINSMPF